MPRLPILSVVITLITVVLSGCSSTPPDDATPTDAGIETTAAAGTPLSYAAERRDQPHSAADPERDSWQPHGTADPEPNSWQAYDPAERAGDGARSGDHGTDCTEGSRGDSDPSGPMRSPLPRLKPPPGTGLAANSTAQLGTIVADELDFTLYRFDDDTAKPSKSTCAGECAETWRPLLVEPPIRAEGIDPDTIGQVTRPDGSLQVTLGGWPVYTFTGDRRPGDLRGHGVDGKWFVVDPTGAKADQSKP